MFNVLSEIRNFKSNKLRKVQTKVVTADGKELIEERDRSGGIVSKELGAGRQIYVADATPDLQIAQIIPGLALGSQDAAQDLNVLKQHNVTHILNLASGVQNAFAGKFAYKSLNVLDQPETNIRAIFDECFSFIDEARNSKGNALVHCNAGISRSATVVIAYLMKYDGLRYSAALDLVKSKRTIKPNDGFLKQLQSYDEELQKSSKPASAPPPPTRQPSVQGPPPPPLPTQKAPTQQAPRQPSQQGPPPRQASQQGPPPRQASLQGPPPRQGSPQGPPPRQASVQGPPPPRQASQQGSQVRIIPVQIERDESEEEESEEEEEEEESEEESGPPPMPITIVSKKK